jgi:transposase InsO family protein
MSVGGKWYVLVIMDDFSRYSWVFFMRTKDEAFEFVRDLILRLKNELPQAMRAIRTDNGTEFKNARFDAFCSDQGLEHQYSSPYTPQQAKILTLYIIVVTAGVKRRFEVMSLTIGGLSLITHTYCMHSTVT